LMCVEQDPAWPVLGPLRRFVRWMGSAGRCERPALRKLALVPAGTVAGPRPLSGVVGRKALVDPSGGRPVEDWIWA